MMSAKTVALDDLVLGKNKLTVKVRVLRLWEARNFKLNGSLMSLDMVLIDEKETLIQASIHHRRIYRFRDSIKEGSVYQLSDFEVVNAYSHYKVTDNVHTIRFMDTTQFSELQSGDCHIKHEKFRIHSLAEFQSFAGTNLHLLDVIGRVMQIQGNNLDDKNSNQKILLLLLLEEKSSIRVTLWGEQAAAFRNQVDQSGRDSHVVVLTCLNPKMFAGQLHLNSTSATKVYMNYDLEVVTDFMKRMENDIDDAPMKIIEENNTADKLELWTIAEIFEYISSGVNAVKEVACRATITDICDRNGWKYLSCGKCSKKLGMSETSLFCNHCQNISTIGVPRFRLELMVKCEEAATTFVMFDRDTKRLTNTTAEALTESEGNNTAMGGSTDSLPTSLLELIGRELNFHIKISAYNFEAAVQSFTINRVLKDTWGSEVKEKNEESIVDGVQTGGSVIIKTENGKRGPNFQPAQTDEEIRDEEDHDEKNPKKLRAT